MPKGDWLPGIAIVLILLFALWVGLAIGYQEGYGDGGDNASTYEQGCAGSGGALTETGICDQETKRDKWRQEEDLNAQRNMAYWAAMMFVSSVSGLILTGLGVFYIAKTLEATREAADFAAATLKETTRLGTAQMEEARSATAAAVQTTEETKRLGEKQVQAYLICNSGAFRIRRFFNNDTKETSFGVTCNVFVGNKGQSPGRNVSFTYEGWLFKTTGPGRGKGFFEFKGSGFCADVGPHDQETGTIESDLMTKHQFQEFRESEVWADIRGEMTWINEFGTGQTQRFHLATPKFWNTDFYESGAFDDSKQMPLSGIASRPWAKFGDS